MSYEMYQEQILDHYKSPRNFGKIEDADVHARDSNPLCGDEIDLYLKLDGQNRVADVKFEGRGCAISQASASMLTQALKGKSMEEVEKIDREFILNKLGIPLSAVRLKCALLSVHILKLAIQQLHDMRRGK